MNKLKQQEQAIREKDSEAATSPAKAEQENATSPKPSDSPLAASASPAAPKSEPSAVSDTAAASPTQKEAAQTSKDDHVATAEPTPAAPTPAAALQGGEQGSKLSRWAARAGNCTAPAVTVAAAVATPQSSAEALAEPPAQQPTPAAHVADQPAAAAVAGGSKLARWTARAGQQGAASGVATAAGDAQDSRAADSGPAVASGSLASGTIGSGTISGAPPPTTGGKANRWLARAALGAGAAPVVRFCGDLRRADVVSRRGDLYNAGTVSPLSLISFHY